MIYSSSSRISGSRGRCSESNPSLAECGWSGNEEARARANKRRTFPLCSLLIHVSTSLFFGLENKSLSLLQLNDLHVCQDEQLQSLFVHSVGTILDFILNYKILDQPGAQSIEAWKKRYRPCSSGTPDETPWTLVD